MDNLNSSNHRKILWPVAAVVLGAAAVINPVYKPHISLSVGFAAWFADMAIVLIFLTHPITARLGVIISGLFCALPVFLRAAPFRRALLMIITALPFVMATTSLFAPPHAGFRGRLGYFFSWMGTRGIERRKYGFDFASFLHLIAATMVLAIGTAGVLAVPAAGLWLLMRWLAGGIAVMAFAEMITASHDFLTALMGINAPALMRSPFLSTSIAEFWTRRWNAAVSQVGFRSLFFAPLARHGVLLALWVTFLASAVAHFLLAYMAMGRWEISIACGVFFFVQPLLIMGERTMGVRRWPQAAARTWTLTALGVTSPLFVEPALQVMAPHGCTIDNVLPFTITVLKCVLMMNLFSSVGQVAFCVKSSAQ